MSYFTDRQRKQAVSMKGKVALFPRNSLVEVTNACNHACVFCHNPFMHRKTGLLDPEVFQRFIVEAQSLGLEEVGLYSTGEPFVAKKLDWYVGCAKDAGVKRVYVTTNGALATLDRVQQCVLRGLDSIKFSINAATRESYHLTHGRDEFDLVYANVREIYEWKSSNGISLQLLGSFIYTKATEHEIELHRKIFSPFFSDIFYSQAQSQGGRTEGNIEGLVEVTQHPDLNQVQPCEMLWNRIHLTCEGYLTACCVDYEHDLTYANYAAGISLAEMWNSERIQALRTRHLERRLDGLICKNCLLGGRDPYSPLSDLRGQFGRKGKFQDDTETRIHKAEARIQAHGSGGNS
jgi:pyruvate-formate lyase-activating enzyme